MSTLVSARTTVPPASSISRGDNHKHAGFDSDDEAAPEASAVGS